MLLRICGPGLCSHAPFLSGAPRIAHPPQYLLLYHFSLPGWLKVPKTPRLGTWLTSEKCAKGTGCLGYWPQKTSGKAILMRWSWGCVACGCKAITLRLCRGRTRPWVFLFQHRRGAPVYSSLELCTCKLGSCHAHLTGVFCNCTFQTYALSSRSSQVFTFRVLNFFKLILFLFHMHQCFCLTYVCVICAADIGLWRGGC